MFSRHWNPRVSKSSNRPGMNFSNPSARNSPKRLDQPARGQPTIEGGNSTLNEEHAMWILSGFADEIDPDLQTQCDVMTQLGISYVEFRSAWDINVLEL